MRLVMFIKRICYTAASAERCGTPGLRTRAETTRHPQFIPAAPTLITTSPLAPLAGPVQTLLHRALNFS